MAAETRPPTRFCIVRHGETDWNAAHRLQGQTDIPLNAAGVAQAAAAASVMKVIPIDQFVSSTLQRALHTAQVLAAGRGDVSTETRLVETNFGDWSGMRWDDLMISYSDLAVRYRTDCRTRAPGGESHAERTTRVMSALLELAQEHAGKTVCVVCHGGVLGDIYRVATQTPLHQRMPTRHRNLSFHWLQYHPKAGAPTGVDPAVLHEELRAASDGSAANELLVSHACWHGAGDWVVEAWDQDAHTSTALHANADVVGQQDHADAPEPRRPPELQLPPLPPTPGTPATPVVMRGEGS